MPHHLGDYDNLMPRGGHIHRGFQDSHTHPDLIFIGTEARSQQAR